MKIEKKQSGNVIILAPISTFFTSKEADLRRAVDAEIRDGGRSLVINLTGIHSMDSSGLGELVALQNMVNRADGTVVLCQPSPQVSELLKISKLDTVFSIYNTERESIRAF